MKTRTVLIVDDDKVIREQLERELKRNFFNTLLAADGKTALEEISHNEVDILIDKGTEIIPVEIKILG